MQFEVSEQGKELQEKLLAFMDECVDPAEPVFEQQMEEAGNPEHHPQIIEDLKLEARKRGLWNLFLPHKKEWTEPRYMLVAVKASWIGSIS